MLEFRGFPDEGLRFLEGLDEDNTRAYFEGNRGVYESCLLEPAKAFVMSLGGELRVRVSKAVQAEPRVNGSIFRINRDTRFSKDKTPYKTYLAFRFWEGADKKTSPGFYMSITPHQVALAAGWHGMDKAALDAYRRAVDDDRSGRSLDKALVSSMAGGVKLEGQTYKRVPRGYDPDHPRANLLKHSQLYVYRQDAVPKSITSARFVDWCAGRLEKFAPLHRWMIKELAPRLK